MNTVLDNIKFRINRYLRRRNPLVLCYHGIHNNEVEFPIWTHLDYKTFEQHLKFIADNCNVISLSALSEQLVGGNFDPYAVAITFDDGYHNNFTNAFPLLAKYKIPATIFVTTDFIGTSNFIWSDNLAAMLTVTKRKSIAIDNAVHLPLTSPQGKANAYRLIANDLKKYTFDQICERLYIIMNQLGVSEDSLREPVLQSCFGHLSWEQILEMQNSGLIEIASHGMSHSILTRCTETVARKEIEKSKELLDSKLLHCPPFSSLISSFAYPNGGPTDYSQDTRKMLIAAGYNLVFTNIQSRVSKISDRYQMPRLCIGNECDLVAFKSLLCH